MRSMTGFGAGEVRSDAGRLVVEVRSVNHRYLEVRVKLPRELVDHQVYVEQLVRQRLSRGRVDVVVHSERSEHAPPTLDRARAVAILRELQSVAAEVGIEGAVPLSVLAGVPELFVHAGDRDPEASRATLRAGLERALDDLDRMRTAEGAHLRLDAVKRVTAVASLVRDLEGRAEAMAERHRIRARERLAKILAGTAIDGARLEHELSVALDHGDVTEELTRLAAHIDQLSRLIGSDEPVGRKLDFLLQEVAREVNTVGAKASEAALAVVELKTEIERLREQAQNIE